MEHFADPRQRALHPLLKRHTAILEARTLAIKEGVTPDDEELRTVEAEIIAIRRDEHPAVELTQECHGHNCKKRIDVRQSAHWLLTPKSLRKFDPTKPVGEQNEFVYPPHLGDVILCPKCGDEVIGRLQEQRVEA